MLLSIENFLFREKFGEENALKMIKNAGFDAVDYSLHCFEKGSNANAIDLSNHIEKAKGVKALLDKYGLKCNQTHAPFIFAYGDEISEKGERFLDIVRSIEFASIIGAKAIVVHAIKVPIGVDFFEYNYNYYKAFEPYARKFDVKIAVENLLGSNLWRAQQLCGFIRQLNSPVFCACVDVGHAAIVGIPPEKFINDMDIEFLECVHLHDTDGQFDRHWIPYQGKHDWDKIIRSLVDIGFNGDMNLEIIHSFDHLPEKLYQPMLNYIGMVGKELINNFNEYKGEIK